MNDLIIITNKFAKKTKLPVQRVEDVYAKILEREKICKWIIMDINRDTNQGYTYCVAIQPNKNKKAPLKTRIKLGVAYCNPKDKFKVVFGNFLAEVRAIGARDLEEELLQANLLEQILYSEKERKE